MKRAPRDAAEIKRVQQLADTALMHADAKVRGDEVCRKFRVRVITMAKKETSYGETEATSYFRRAA